MLVAKFALLKSEILAAFKSLHQFKSQIIQVSTVQFFTSFSVFILFEDLENKIRKAKTLNVFASIINLAILSLRMNKFENKIGLLAYNIYIEKYLSYNQTIQTKDLLWKCNFHLLIIPCLKHRHEINRLSKDVHL